VPRIDPAPTRPDQVAEQLRRRIVAGEFPIGSLLPTEAELSRELGVGRNGVREGLRALIHAGMLGARAGYGTYVRATSDVAPVLARRVGEDRPEDVDEVRLVLEREGARLAALRATPEQRQELQAALAARSLAGDGRDYVSADIAFHRMLMEASGNALLAELYRGIGGNEQSLVPMSAPDFDLAAEADALHDVDVSHTAIVDAVLARDPDAAAAAAQRTVELAQAHAASRRDPQPTEGHA
jgi:DNA-binding FadR family transcriptional regulator